MVEVLKHCRNRPVVINHTQCLTGRATKDNTIFTMNNIEPLISRNGGIFWGPRNLKKSSFDIQVMTSAVFTEPESHRWFHISIPSEEQVLMSSLLSFPIFDEIKGRLRLIPDLVEKTFRWHLDQNTAEKFE